jgi:hypothetical protein
MGFAGGEHDFHDPQAFVIAHLRPARDLGGGAMATLTQAVVAEAAYTDAGAEDSTEMGIHRNESIERGLLT